MGEIHIYVGSDVGQRLIPQDRPCSTCLAFSCMHFEGLLRVGGLRNFCLLTFGMELNFIHQDDSCVLSSMKVWVGFGIRVRVIAIFPNKACLAEYASAQNLLKLYR